VDIKEYTGGREGGKKEMGEVHRRIRKTGAPIKLETGEILKRPVQAPGRSTNPGGLK